MLTAGVPVDAPRLAALCSGQRRADPGEYEETWLPYIRSVGVCVGTLEEMVGLVELVEPWVCWIPRLTSSTEHVLAVHHWVGLEEAALEDITLPPGAFVLIRRAPEGWASEACVAMEDAWAPWYSLMVNDASASRHHALLNAGALGQAARVVDLGSTNGTYLVRNTLGVSAHDEADFEQIVEADLAPGDRLYFGRTAVWLR